MSGSRAFNEEEIIIGDKVDLVTQSGAVYRTMIEDRFNDGPFLAGIPNKKGVFMHVAQDDDVYVVFYRDSGRFIAQMKVIALENRGELRYMWLMQKTQAQKNQRRNAFRLPVSFDVQIYDFVEDEEQGITYVPDEVKATALELVSSKDISVTGIALQTKKKYELEEKYTLSLHFHRNSESIRFRSVQSDTTPALHLTAIVKRCIPWRTGNTFNTGMHFFGMTESMSDGIAKYVLAEQQRQLKKKSMLI